MRLTRNLITILVLASFTFAFAGETEKDAKRHEASAVESKEVKDCGQCNGCVKGPKKTTPSKVRDTGPDDALPASLLYIP